MYGYTQATYWEQQNQLLDTGQGWNDKSKEHAPCNSFLFPLKSLNSIKSGFKSEKTAFETPEGKIGELIAEQPVNLHKWNSFTVIKKPISYR